MVRSDGLYCAKMKAPTICASVRSTVSTVTLHAPSASLAGNLAVGPAAENDPKAQRTGFDDLPIAQSAHLVWFATASCLSDDGVEVGWCSARERGGERQRDRRATGKEGMRSGRTRVSLPVVERFGLSPSECGKARFEVARGGDTLPKLLPRCPSGRRTRSSDGAGLAKRRGEKVENAKRER